jgi:hypothetical protein
MATNDVYKKAWAIPLTVGASVAVRSPVVVGKLSGITLTPTGSSGTQVATVLRHGAAEVEVAGKADAITITLGSVLNAETIIVNGKTYLAHTNTTDAAAGQFSIAGNDTADAVELVKCMVDGTAGLAGCTVTSSGAVVTIVSDATITAVTGTAESGGKAVVDHAVTGSSEVAEGDEIFIVAGTPNVLSKQASGIHFGWAMGTVADRKITLASVTNNQTIIINGYTFTAKTSTTTIADRFFSIAGDDTADAALLAANINAAGYGVPGITATAATGVITLTGDPDVTITGTAVSAGTCVVEAGTRTINVKLGY